MDSTDKEKILQIAHNVRRWAISEFGDNLSETCGIVSRVLKKQLLDNGFNNVYVASGVFKIDKPNLSEQEIKYMRDEYYDAFESEEDFLNSFYWPSHYWTEINGNILDITVDQFNDEMNEKMPEVYFGKNSRYRSINKE